MHITLFSLALTTLLFLFSSPVYSEPDTKSSWTGYLCDVHCMQAQKSSQSNEEFVRSHTRACALSANAKTSGYAIYSEGKWYLLDQKGNGLAVKILENSIRKADIFVLAEGRSDGHVLTVERLSDLTGMPGR